MDPRSEQPDDGRDEAGEEEPELQVQGHHVGRAHCVERRGFECRYERRVGRVGELPEELLVEPSEEVERLRLGNPERPAVEVRQSRQPARPKDGLDVDDDEAAVGRRDEGEPLQAPTAEPRTLVAEAPSEHEPRGRQGGTREQDRHGAKRHAEHELDRERDPETSDAEHVRQSRQPRELRPRPQTTTAPEQTASSGEHHDVRESEPQERPHRHPRNRPTVTPASFCQTTWSRSPKRDASHW